MKRPYPELQRYGRSRRAGDSNKKSRRSLPRSMPAWHASKESSRRWRRRAAWSSTGNDAAELYSTYGIPPELVESLAAERNFTFDTEGFRQAMIQHGIRFRARQQIELFKTGPIEALKKVLARDRRSSVMKRSKPRRRSRGSLPRTSCATKLTEIGHDQPVTVVLGPNALLRANRVARSVTPARSGRRRHLRFASPIRSATAT